MILHLSKTFFGDSINSDYYCYFFFMCYCYLPRFFEIVIFFICLSLWYSCLQTSEFVVKEGELLVNSLVGLSALVHNGSNLGFNKRRGAANW